MFLVAHFRVRKLKIGQCTFFKWSFQMVNPAIPVAERWKRLNRWNHRHYDKALVTCPQESYQLLSWALPRLAAHHWAHFSCEKLAYQAGVSTRCPFDSLSKYFGALSSASEVQCQRVHHCQSLPNPISLREYCYAPYPLPGETESHFWVQSALKI